MGDLVQRVSVTITAGNASATIYAGTDYVAPAANSFIRVVGSEHASSGNASSASDSDLTAVITNPGNLATSITLTRNDTTGAAVFYLEIYDFSVLPSTHSIEVRHVEAGSIASSVATWNSSAVSGVVSDSKVVPIYTSQESTAADEYGLCVTSFLVDWDSVNQKITLTRGVTALAPSFSVALLEFTGSAWANVQRIAHTYTSANTAETENLTTTLGGLGQAFIAAASFNTNVYSYGDNHFQRTWIYSTTQVAFYKSRIGGTDNALVWVVEDTTGGITAQHITNTIAAATGSQTDSVSAVTLARAAVFGEGSTATSTISGVDNQLTLGYTLSDTTHGQVVRQDSTIALYYNYSVVEFPAASSGSWLTRNYWWDNL